jgi:hypothetical protein
MELDGSTDYELFIYPDMQDRMAAGQSTLLCAAGGLTACSELQKP